MSLENKRNYVLDLLRFLFSIMIVIHHSFVITNGEFRYAPSGYIGVEFFFLVTGFYMMSYIERFWQKKGQEPVDIGLETRRFVLKKADKIWPYLIVSDVVALIALAVYLKEDIVHNVIYAFSEIFMVQMAGFPGSYPTGTAWYLSALMLALLVLFPVALKFKSMFLNVLAPLISVMIIGYLSLMYGSVGSDPGVWVGHFGKGLLRAIAEIALGAVCYGVSRQFEKCKVRLTLEVVLGMLEILCYAGVAYVAYRFQPGKTDVFAIGLLFAGVVITASRKSISYRLCNFRFFGVLGKLSMTIFLNNFYWSKCVRSMFPAASEKELLLYYMGISLLTAVVVYIAASGVRTVIQKLKTHILR